MKYIFIIVLLLSLIGLDQALASPSYISTHKHMDNHEVQTDLILQESIHPRSTAVIILDVNHNDINILPVNQGGSE